VLDFQKATTRSYGFRIDVAGARAHVGQFSNYVYGSADRVNVRGRNSKYHRCLLCATFVPSVSLWWTTSKVELTTETRRTPRLHGDYLLFSGVIYTSSGIDPKDSESRSRQEHVMRRG